MRGKREEQGNEESWVKKREQVINETQQSEKRSESRKNRGNKLEGKRCCRERTKEKVVE